jgi:starch synthase (maltosyl-transferring)
MEYPALSRIVGRLKERLTAGSSASPYSVPGLWLDPRGRVESRTVSPERFFLDRISSILDAEAQPLITDDGRPGEWSRYAVAYNLFVRVGAACDHDRSGHIEVAPSAGGWRETGTFLKATTLLPFIRSLGCNTIHLLPVTAIGRDGNKGNLGSPFAIRDPYALDEGQSEPALGLGAEVEFAAFVEAAHHLGLRVVVEFVFRTAAKDAVWAGEHPEWFYWIRADIPDRQPGETSEVVYGAPLFLRDELDEVYRVVGTGVYEDTLPPHRVYRRMFLPPPQPETVRLVDGRWRGLSRHPETGELVPVRIPGAFADWTPDSDQPPWNDVTYLRLYDHPDFNYIAYNTVRFYDLRLAQPENAVTPLWDRIVEVIPHYQRTYGIDGVMIDRGHALPLTLKQRLVTRARDIKPDFALWAEDFQLRESSRLEGYNVCLGPFLQTVRDPARLAWWLSELAKKGVPVPFMATPENHNTPRAVRWPGGLGFALYAMTVGAFLPGVPYVHGGLELAETHPVNTGFDFSQEEQAALPPEVLPLFSAAAYDWTRRDTLVDGLRRVFRAREPYRETVTDSARAFPQPVITDNPHIIGFARGARDGLAVFCNSNMREAQSSRAPLPGAHTTLVDILTGERFAQRDGLVDLTLAPAQVVALRFGGES